jgi:hypothetical protein
MSSGSSERSKGIIFRMPGKSASANPKGQARPVARRYSAGAMEVCRGLDSSTMVSASTMNPAAT